MEFFKKNNILRDSLCFCMLIACISVLVARNKTIDNVPRPGAQKSFSVHEVDPTTLEQVVSLEKQIDTTMQFVRAFRMNANVLEQLDAIAQEVESIKSRYTHTSPAVAMLGPIGSVGVVLKEQELNNKLLKKIQQLNNLLAHISKAERTDNQPQNVAKLLEQNETFITHLHYATA